VDTWGHCLPSELYRLTQHERDKTPAAMCVDYINLFFLGQAKYAGLAGYFKGMRSGYEKLQGRMLASMQNYAAVKG